MAIKTARAYWEWIAKIKDHDIPIICKRRKSGNAGA